MNDNNEVKIDHVSKYFRLPTDSTTSLRTTLVNRFRGVKGYKEQHVLKDIDFEVEKGTGAVLLGEVSQCNDDNTDNRFYEEMGRFPKIEEDEAPYRLLCTEYPAAK